MAKPSFSATRRAFVIAGAGAVTAPGLLLDLALPRVAAAELEVFDAAAAQTLLAVCRTLFPHARLGDAPYMDCVRGIDVRARDDAAYRKLVGDALEKLPHDFATRDAVTREQALAALETTPAFRALRGAASRIYRNPAVWPAFDYAGPSAPFGGYADKLILELDWLPQARRRLAGAAS
ncbi:MAG: hypothetical protein ACU85V_09565 [Gammaproteobacteria bacterium]